MIIDVTKSGIVLAPELIEQEPVRWLAERLFGKRPAIERLHAEGALLKISAHIDAESYVCGFDLEPELLQELGRAHIKLGVLFRFQKGFSA